MPRDGSGVYSIPPGTHGAPETTIQSAEYNSFVDDVATDLNYPRPILAGGTGAVNAPAALVNLGAEASSQIIVNYNSDPMVSGSFSSSATAMPTGAPVANHAFAGIIYAVDNNNMVIEARDESDTVVPGRVYVREKKAGVWGTWSTPGSVYNEPPNDGVLYGRQQAAGVASWQPFNAAINIGAAPILRGYIDGYNMQAGGGTTLGVYPGSATDSTNSTFLTLGALLSKTTAAWAPGNGGGLETSTILASTWYHVFVIFNPTTTALDVLFSLSPIAPTLPLGFTKFRRIGSALTDASKNWTAFKQRGDRFSWINPVGVGFTNPGTSSFTFAVGTPTGVVTEAKVFVGNLAPVVTDQAVSWFATEIGLADTAPTISGGVLSTAAFASTASPFTFSGGDVNWIFTDTAAQIRLRLQVSGSGTIIRVVTLGWRDSRGKDV